MKNTLAYHSNIECSWLCPCDPMALHSTHNPKTLGSNYATNIKRQKMIENSFEGLTASDPKI